jgi:hypothetical protein
MEPYQGRAPIKPKTPRRPMRRVVSRLAPCASEIGRDRLRHIAHIPSCASQRLRKRPDSNRRPGLCWARPQFLPRSAETDATSASPELVRRALRTVPVMGLLHGKPYAAATKARVLARNLAVIVVSGGLAACGAVPGTPSFSPSATLTVTQADNGRSVSMHVGQSLVVQLNSTYWMVSGSSDPVVLAQQGSEQIAPSPGGCVPGQGCGTVTASFEAIRAGHSVVTASRSVCGEVVLCASGQRTFSVAVQVS